MEILIIEDDKIWQNVYQESIGKFFPVKLFGTLDELDVHLKNKTNPFVLIADLKLLDQSFLTYLKSHPELTTNAKVLVVSSVDDVDVLEECYALGISDYLTKPINTHELIVKTRRLVDFASNKNSLGLQIDRISNRIRYEDHEIQLTPREFQILNYLIERKENGIHKEELLKAIWKNTSVTSNTIEVHICNIRKKLEPMGFEIGMKAPHTFCLNAKPSSPSSALI